MVTSTGGERKWAAAGDPAAAQQTKAQVCQSRMRLSSTPEIRGCAF